MVAPDEIRRDIAKKKQDLVQLIERFHYDAFSGPGSATSWTLPKLLPKRTFKPIVLASDPNPDSRFFRSNFHCRLLFFHCPSFADFSFDVVQMRFVCLVCPLIVALIRIPRKLLLLVSKGVVYIL
uniref:(northern house mosquito) hypothetical protein n=1 Tax=Culex pipiens TaxID=7175 RepID=A0A8D8B0N2_CULPI